MLSTGGRLLVAFYVAVFSLYFFVGLATAEPRVDRIEVQGNRQIESETILIQLISKAGEALRQERVERDIKELYRTGFFEQVKARIEQKGAQNILVFQVIEKPAIRRVLVQGNKEVKTDRLKEKLGLDLRRFLDKKKLRAGIKQAEEYYRSQGFYDTKIDYTVASVENNQVDVTFVVKEGTKKVLREIVFNGNKSFDAGDLEEAIKTKTYFWLTSWLTGSGVIKEEQLQDDVKELTRFYLNNGYAEVRVSDPVTEETEDGIRLVFNVQEGEVFEFGYITAQGDLLGGSVAKTLTEIECKSGETFNVDKLRKDTFTISDKFTDIGYAYANVMPQTNIEHDNKKVSITFEINKGSLINVNRIDLSGNQKTADNVIRRSLKINERQLFSSSKIRRSQELLRRTGFFDEVTITPDAAEKKDEVDLNVAVREANTGSFSVGAGVSSGEGFILNTRITESNIFGTGRSVGLNADLGTRNENFILSFDDPRLNDSLWSFGAEALSTKREFDDFDREQKGGSLTFGHPLAFLGEEAADDIKAFLSYQLLDINIKNVDTDASDFVKRAEGNSTASSVTPKLVRNTIDNPLNPTKGSRQILAVELAGLGGAEEFWLGQAANTFYYPLVETEFGPLVFSQRTRVNWGESNNDDPFPLFRRFFPGGINSVRGFSPRKMGPKDELGNYYGGAKELVGNFEVIFPLFAGIGLKGVTFYDIGNAFDDEQSVEFSELRHAAGAGIRWSSPLGPIRLEFGTPLDREDGENNLQTMFSFGSPL